MGTDCCPSVVVCLEHFPKVGFSTPEANQVLGAELKQQKPGTPWSSQSTGGLSPVSAAASKIFTGLETSSFEIVGDKP